MYVVGRQKSASYLAKKNSERRKFFYARDNIYESAQCEEFLICMNKTISSQIALLSTSIEYLMPYNTGVCLQSCSMKVLRC
jgi:hypothetical protein